MTRGVWERPEPSSPCVKVCVIHPEARICVGCHRTGDEIARWPRMNEEERIRIMSTLGERARLLKTRRGGRASRRGRGLGPRGGD